jgi:hypothetical protein
MAYISTGRGPGATPAGHFLAPTQAIVAAALILCAPIKASRVVVAFGESIEPIRDRSVYSNFLAICGFSLIGLLLSAFVTFSAQSEDLRDVTLRFLQRHGVPCGSVTKVESLHGLDETAVCEDGREWALFWLEDEIAFVHPRTRELYRWQVDVYWSQPQLYGSMTLTFQGFEVGAPNVLEP